MIYGWGTDHVAKQVDQSTVAVCRFKYVSLAFLFSLVWQREWFLQGQNRALDREVTTDEIANLFGHDAVPTPGLWKRFGIFITIGAFLAAVGVSNGFQALTGGGAGDSGTVAVAVTADQTDLVSATVSPTSDSVEIAEQDTVAEVDDGANPAAPSADEADQIDASAEESVSSTEAIVEVGELTQLSESNRVSLALQSPTVGYGTLIPRNVFASSAPVEVAAVRIEPAADTKVLVFDINLLTEDNFSITSYDSNFVRVADSTGRLYNSEVGFVGTIEPGDVRDSRLAFVVPRDETSLLLQAGVVEPDAGGLQAQWQIELEASPDEYPGAAAVPIIEGAISIDPAADAQSATLRAHRSNTAQLKIIDGSVSAQLDGIVPRSGYKWVTAELEIVYDGATRVIRLDIRGLTDGLWVENDAPLRGVSGGAGEIDYLQLAFQVPAAATELQVEVGTPSFWEDSDRMPAQFQLTLP